MNTSAEFENSGITSLGKLKIIGWDAVFMNSKVKTLGQLQEIGQNAYIANSPLTRDDFKNIKIGSDIIE